MNKILAHIIIISLSHSVFAKEICCNKATRTTVSVDEEGKPISIPKSFTEDISKEVWGASSAIKNLSVNVGGKFSIKYEGGTGSLNGTRFERIECCNATPREFIRLDPCKANLKLPSGSVTLSGLDFAISPFIRFAGTTFSIIGEEADADLFYKNDCSPGKPNDTGYAAFTMSYAFIPVSGSISTTIFLGAGYKNLIEGGSSTKATVKFTTHAKFLFEYGNQEPVVTFEELKGASLFLQIDETIAVQSDLLGIEWIPFSGSYIIQLV